MVPSLVIGRLSVRIPKAVFRRLPPQVFRPTETPFTGNDVTFHEAGLGSWLRAPCGGVQLSREATLAREKAVLHDIGNIS